jgi:DNA mismatch repair protein MSH5
MPPSFKRKRQSSAASVTSHPSRAASSRRRTPLVSFNLPSLASQPQSQHRRVTIASQPQLERDASSSQPRLLQNAQQSAAVDEDDTDEALDNVIMAIDMKEHGTVGCAYYVAREERLFCMEDVVHGGTDTVETC